LIWFQYQIVSRDRYRSTVELRQLRYFVAVAEELHFRRAAARLHMSQPPLSQQIAALESELGVRLLERTRRRVELTPAGEAFLRDARATLAELDVAVSTARAIAAGSAGVLRLKEELLRRANVAAAPYHVRDVLLKEMLVQ